jgi:membrane protease subunit HflK
VLTRDENIVDIKFNVQYVVSDPRNFLFGFRDDVSVDGKLSQGRESMQNAAESAVREVVGNNTMDTVLFERTDLIMSAKTHLQETLNQYDTGMVVTGFTLQCARPPEMRCSQELMRPAKGVGVSERENAARSSAR